MRIGTDAGLHARHHRTGLANGSIGSRDAWVHLHALLHGVAGAWGHHVALLHLHAGLLRKVRGLHHLARRMLRPASRNVESVECAGDVGQGWNPRERRWRV